MVARDNFGWNFPSSSNIHPSVQFGSRVKNVRIGHGVTIHRDVYIDVEDFFLGDYVTVHHGSVLHGKQISIGHNSWIGHYCILDGLGGKLLIGNNVGIGAQSQIWTHMKFGDRLAGNNWFKSNQSVIEDDVWLVGHCLFATEKAERKSMLLLGGMATQNMAENRIYAGSPAKDVTERFGYQFSERENSAVMHDWSALCEQFKTETSNSIDFIETHEQYHQVDSYATGKTHFFILDRTYLPTYSISETSLMKWLLYEKAKFVPINNLETK